MLFDKKMDGDEPRHFKNCRKCKGKLKGQEANKLIALSKNDKLYENIQQDISRIGVCSFSLDTKNVLMWTHYSNNHKGMAILYRFPEDYLNDRNKFIGITNVTYEEKNLDTAVGQSIQSNNLADASELVASYVFKNGSTFVDERGIINIELRSFSLTVMNPIQVSPKGYDKELYQRSL